MIVIDPIWKKYTYIRLCYHYQLLKFISITQVIVYNVEGIFVEPCIK